MSMFTSGILLLTIIPFALFTAASGQDVLKKSSSAAVGDVGATVSEEPSWLDAFFEAGITFAAFLVAAAIIHVMRKRSQKKVVAKSAARKAEKLMADRPLDDVAALGPRASGQSPSRHDPPSTPSPCDSLPDWRKRSGNVRAPRQRQPAGSSHESDYIVAAIRGGRAGQLTSLLDAAHARVEENGVPAEEVKAAQAQHLLSALRACAAHRCFAEALKAYDHECKRIGDGCGAMWSLLLYSAIEAGELHRCKELINALLDNASPSPNDFLNLVRYHVLQHDAEGLKHTLERLRSVSFAFDAVSRNRALSVCLASHAFNCADVLIDENHCNIAMDVVALNTLMKGFAKAGEPARCFDLCKQMQGKGLQPSEVTFGILLDVCIDAKDFDRAKQVFASLRRSGLPMNVVHYTTFMKGLISAGYLEEATELLDEMVKSPSTKPDLVTYSTLVKAHADHGKVFEAIKVLERMLEQGIPADAIIFNIVLTGCCAQPMDPEQIFRVFQVLVKHGLNTSTTTLSILVKALAQSHAFESALDMLNNAHERFGIWPETRLFAQLAQACAKVGNGKKALESYEAMVHFAARQGIPVEEAVNSRLLRCCSSCGESAAATKLHVLVASAGGYPKLEDVSA